MVRCMRMTVLRGPERSMERLRSSETILTSVTVVTGPALAVGVADGRAAVGVGVPGVLA